MGAPKYQIYDEAEILIAKMFQAFSTPARAKIILLLTSKDKTVSSQKELQKELGLSQSTVSKHLSKMFSGGVLEASLATDSVQKKSCLKYRVNSIATAKIIEFGKWMEESSERFSKYQSDKLITFCDFFSKQLRHLNFEAPS
jgi:DNA-binding transcriptional ArsR family regulator